MDQDDSMDARAEHSEALGGTVSDNELERRFDDPNYKELRQRVEKVLRDSLGIRRRLTDSQWHRAIADIDVQPSLNAEGVYDVALRLAGWQRAGILSRGRERAQSGSVRSNDPRYAALAEILATEAERSGDVGVWRLLWLGRSVKE